MGPGGCPCLTSKTDECFDKGYPQAESWEPQEPSVTEEHHRRLWHLTFSRFGPKKEKTKKKKHSYRPTKFLLIQVKGLRSECGVAVRDEGQRRLTRGTLAVGEHNKLLSHHKTSQPRVLSCNPVMDTSSAPQLVKMFSYNNLIQEHIYKAGVINFN